MQKIFRNYPTDDAIQNITKLYKASLVLPRNKTAPQFILCPIGLVGAGKTTVIQPLTDHFSLIRVSTDEIRRLLSENGQRREWAQKIAANIIEEFLSSGYGVAIDADCIAPAIQGMIQSLSVKYNSKLLWIHIHPPEEYILQKLKNFKHTWLFKNAEEAIETYYQRKPLHENISLPFIFEFDTSKSKEDIKNQIKKCIQAININIGKKESSSS